MRRIASLALLLASAGALTTHAFAQRYPSGRDPYYGGRDASSNRDPYGYRSGDPVDRAIGNLQSAAGMNRYDRHERDHFDKAIRELAKFQDRRRSGRFDRGALDKALESMSDLARANQLHPRARDIIARDLSELRSLRDYGAGGNRPYYDGAYDPSSNRGHRDSYGRW